MLPFLKNTKEASASMPVESIKRDHDEDMDLLEACAHDLVDAVHSKDIKRVADALKAAFQICDSEPHEEGKHI